MELKLEDGTSFQAPAANVHWNGNLYAGGIKAARRDRRAPLWMEGLHGVVEFCCCCSCEVQVPVAFSLLPTLLGPQRELDGKDSLEDRLGMRAFNMLID